MAVLYRLSQNNNKKNTKAYGKWYARAVATNTIGLNEVAQRIQQNCSMKKSDVKAVLDELIEVMTQELQNSHVVKLDGLGSFRMGLNSTGTVTVREFNASKNVVGIHVCFQPEQKRGADKKTVKSLINGATVKEAPKNTVMAEPNEDEGENEGASDGNDGKDGEGGQG